MPDSGRDRGANRTRAGGGCRVCRSPAELVTAGRKGRCVSGIASCNERIAALRSALTTGVTPAAFLAAEDARTMVGDAVRWRWEPWAFALLAGVVAGAALGSSGLARLAAAGYMVAVGLLQLRSSPAVVAARRRFDAGRAAVGAAQVEAIAADFAVVAATYQPMARRVALVAVLGGVTGAALLPLSTLALLAAGRAALLVHAAVTAQAMCRVADEVIAEARAQPWHAPVVAARDRADAGLRDTATGHAV